MNPSTITETAKALKAAGLDDKVIAAMIADSMGNVAVEPVTTGKPAASPRKPRGKDKTPTTFTLTASDVKITSDTIEIADQAIEYALATGESKEQMKVKAAELFSVSGILECIDQEQALEAWDLLLAASVAVPDKIENRNSGKMVSARWTAGPKKGKIKWTVSTSLSALFERGREMIHAFIPMRDDQGYAAAQDKLFVADVWVPKADILAVSKVYKPKTVVKPVVQSRTNAKALQGVITKYVLKKSDAVKVKAEIFPILDEIKAYINKKCK